MSLLIAVFVAIASLVAGNLLWFSLSKRWFPVGCCLACRLHRLFAGQPAVLCGCGLYCSTQPT